MRVGEVGFKPQIQKTTNKVATTIELSLEPEMRQMIDDSRIGLKYFRSQKVQLKWKAR